VKTAITTRQVIISQAEKRSNGTYWKTRIAPIFDKDELVYVTVEFDDVTAKVEARQQLLYEKNSNDTYRLMK
jgi:hypothetical protein